MIKNKSLAIEKNRGSKVMKMFKPHLKLKWIKQQQKEKQIVNLKEL